MDYAEMARKLDAVRKEIRANVFHLAIIDRMREAYNIGLEDWIWTGKSSYFK